MNKKAKKKYQVGEQTRLLNLKNGNNTREFWREIGKLGIQYELKTVIPMEVKDSNGHVSTHTDDVMDTWKNYFVNLFSNSTKTHFDDNHLE